MAKINFVKMSTKRLEVLLTTASDEDKVEIQKVLDRRAQKAMGSVQEPETPVEKPVKEDVGVMPLPTEPEVPAEKKDGRGRVPAERMTDEQLAELIEKCKENINHKCEVIPFGRPEWVEGTIIAVTAEKKTNKALYAIRTEEGKRIVKVYNSPQLKISEELAEKENQVHIKAEKDPWTEEVINNLIEQYEDNVGRTVQTDGMTGRILTIIPDRRSQILLYRIEVPAPTEVDPAAVKIVHRVTTSNDVIIDTEAALDETGSKLNAKFLARRSNAMVKARMTPEEKIIRAENELKAAEEALNKAQTSYDIKKAHLDKLKAEYLKDQADKTDTEE